MGEKDYLFVLEALNDLPFEVGKKLLIEFLQGNEESESITKNKLYKLSSFGSLAYSKEELDGIINNLTINGFIEQKPFSKNKFWKVMQITQKGRDELANPEFYKRKLSYSYEEKETHISEKEKALFDSFEGYLSRYNDEQKKAIITNKSHVLCIAGAGSGKTTVLTKRIDFLVKYRSVDPEKILAITFTRKARQEMQERLSTVKGIKVETFNSFCEKILRKHNNIIYEREVRVITYKDKITILRKALQSLNLDLGKAIDIYFTYAQQRSKTREQLANLLMNDCFFLRDYFKFKGEKIKKEDFLSHEYQKSADMVFGICNYIESFMAKNGLRDFADQLVDTIAFFDNNKEQIPEFEHVLIDEYQDVNSAQIHLIDLLNPANIFAVGDPRQSIYGWRGSDIKYILNFEKKYEDVEIITLKKNYRSSKYIVDFFNKSIDVMNLPDLEAVNEGKKDIKIIKFDNEEGEFEFVVQSIIESSLPRKEIFVLARTNRQLNDIALRMNERDIRFVLRNNDYNSNGDEDKDEDKITLATIHGIKGLEAKTVFVIGANSFNFPCRGSEHPVVDMVKIDEYDKEEEERRLFYVALSRARESLYISYTGKKTNFLTEKMEVMIKKAPEFDLKKSSDLLSRLKSWRKQKAQEMELPAYFIMNDKTLLDIASRLPSSKEELQDIHGFGPTKIMKFGDEILSILNGK